MGSERKCPICGETDPMPDSYCLAKMARCAPAGRPCQYSREGQARTHAAMREQSIRFTAAIEADRARRSALSTTTKGEGDE